MSEASPTAKMLACAVRLEGVLVDRHVVELVAEAGARDEVGAHVERDGDQQVEGDLALVVGHEAFASLSMRSTRKSDSTRILRSSSMPPSCSEAIGLVNAPDSGVT